MILQTVIDHHDMYQAQLYEILMIVVRCMQKTWAHILFVRTPSSKSVILEGAL
jgi:hypothetical protein